MATEYTESKGESVIAIVGATGLVGSRLAQLVGSKLGCKMRLFANDSVGSKVCVCGKTYVVQSLQQLQDVPKYALFATKEEVAAKLVPQLAKAGTVCIDNSKHFRLRKDVPLVVPQINGNTVAQHKIVANPNCTTIQVAIALHALRSLQPTEMTVVTFQAASGAGKEGLDDLLLHRNYGTLKAFAHPIWDNLIPQIGKVGANGRTEEEEKLRRESRKILQMALRVNAFCVRVPVSVGHGAFVNVRFKQKIDVQKVRQLLAAANILLLDNAERQVFPMPCVVRNTSLVAVGRLHLHTARSLNMFVVADNLLVGAARNAFDILQVAMRNNGHWEGER